jgi:hypothetical protein
MTLQSSRDDFSRSVRAALSAKAPIDEQTSSNTAIASVRRARHRERSAAIAGLVNRHVFICFPFQINCGSEFDRNGGKAMR